MEQPPAEGAAPSHPLRWLPEYLKLSRRRLRPQARLLGLSLVVGVVAGAGAVVFYAACQAVVHFALDVVAGYQPPAPGGEPGLFGASTRALVPWLLLVVPAVGGLASGWLVYTLAPEAEGHGTDSAIAAYHYRHGEIRPRVPLVKIVASALTIGTGGSGGREGPIAQIGAGCGSALGRVLHLRPAEQRVLMAAGMGAGVAAIFRAPLAGALFAAEVMYRSPDFESEVIIPAGLASVMAYCTFCLVFGWAPLFDIPAGLKGALAFDDPWQLVPYLFLAVAMAVLAMVYTRSFYGLTHLFHRLPLRPHNKPALGAFLTGGFGLALYFGFSSFGDGPEPRALGVLSFGYGVLQDALVIPPAQRGSLYFAAVLLAVAVGKILTTGLTIGSGGSGGVFGPSMVIGGCAGGALGVLLHHFRPALVPYPATFAIVGMAGFFAAAAKTPFSTLVMVSEITGNYNLLLPALWVCALAFLLSDEQSIYSSQAESRSRSPVHQGDFVREVLAGLAVRQFLGAVKERPVLRAEDRLERVVEELSRTSYHALPVTDKQNRLLGMVSLEEVLLASQSPHLGPLVVAADLMRTGVTPLSPDDRLDRAMELFVESGLLVLPVADTDGRVVGIVQRADVARTYLQTVHGTSRNSAP